MNDNHVIESWIAELGMSGRRLRPRLTPTQAEASAEDPRAATPAPPARATKDLQRRYALISVPCGSL